ncbi:nicotinate-nucleotide adenylyltransferase [Liquorilactobacillus mali]|uniref:Probable nicotinate-nucleotide adenylyltransferase n=1 Tax=Liquorilactobacillus mali TaxID=1618 RepID=A0A0R2G7M3_9LACO|nr:nicotinate-nucleotide adenylyltransferase [Liquorilactobacillus mali]KRN34245.1 nicotinate-nucleotide adenylyltransferase (Deamido-NAD(+) pyrophosphorylase) [Liquorilactobacillus mali]MDN7144335.1 nicotinate-nucleotide adenylyltransferase [Liquorilactobacillus mali]
MNVNTLVKSVVQTKPIVEPNESGKKKRVGILGGTFNPPHTGHLIIAEQVTSQLDLDEMLFMPDALPPHVDHKDTIAAEDRRKMVELSIAENPLFGLETAELERGGISYTFDTIVELKRKHPDYEYYFVIGGDMVDYLPKWYRIDELVKLVHFVGVARTGFPKESKYPVMWVDVPLIEISSTQIRWNIQHNCSIKYLVPKDVEHYIKEEGLYLE